MSVNHLHVTRGSGGRFQSWVDYEMEQIRWLQANPDHYWWKEKAMEYSEELKELVGEEERNRRVEEQFPDDDFTYMELCEWYLQQIKTEKQRRLCLHSRVEARGGWHFYGGEVYDDIRHICIDCGAEVEA